MPNDLIIQPAEVVFVNLKDSNPRNLYSIRAKPIHSGKGSTNTTAVNARPLDQNLIKIPTQGEIVLLVKGPTSNSDNNIDSFEYYYCFSFNIQSSVHHNALPNLGKINIQTDESNNYNDVTAGNTKSNQTDDFKLGESFKELTSVKPLQPFEGDVIYQGRWGQSIRFGSTINSGFEKYTLAPTWKIGNSEEGSPITIIRNSKDANSNSRNKFIVEDINDDASSIYLTDGQSIPLNLPSSIFNSIINQKINSFANNPPFSGKQIILSSGRIILCSKVSEILLSAKAGIGFSTDESISFDAKKEVELNAQKIKLGVNANQPIILGNDFKEWAESLIDAISSITVPTSSGPSGTPINIPQFTIIKNRLQTILSNIAFVGKSSVSDQSLVISNTNSSTIPQQTTTPPEPIIPEPEPNIIRPEKLQDQIELEESPLRNIDGGEDFQISPDNFISIGFFEELTSSSPDSIPNTSNTNIIFNQPDITFGPEKQNIRTVINNAGFGNTKVGKIIEAIAYREGWNGQANNGTGTRSFRNNNPGNLDYTKSYESIDPNVRLEENPFGSNRFARFSTPEYGVQALANKIYRWANGFMPITAVSSTFTVPDRKNPSIRQFFQVYAPNGDGANNSEQYAQSVAASLNENVDVKVRNLL